MTNPLAPAGAVWVCPACGKTHKDRYGERGPGDQGWDESCAMRAVPCREDSLTRDANGRVTSASLVEEPLL